MFGQGILWLLYAALTTVASSCVIGMCNGIGRWATTYFLAMCCVAVGLHCSPLSDPTIAVVLLAAIPVVLHMIGEQLWQ